MQTKITVHALNKTLSGPTERDAELEAACIVTHPGEPGAGGLAVLGAAHPSRELQKCQCGGGKCDVWTMSPEARLAVVGGFTEKNGIETNSVTCVFSIEVSTPGQPTCVYTSAAVCFVFFCFFFFVFFS